MRNLALNTFVSLDGVMQAPGGPHEDPARRVRPRGLGRQLFDEQMIEKMAGADPYELLLGRGTYEMFAAHWPYDEGPIADHLNRTRKHVASKTRDRVEWNNSTLIAGDLADYLEARKREPGPEVQVHGSPGLIQTLLEHDLIDEFRIWTFPVVLGTGKRLFGDGAIPVALRLLGSAVSKTGVTINTHARAGEIETGELGGERYASSMRGTWLLESSAVGH